MGASREREARAFEPEGLERRGCSRGAHAVRVGRTDAFALRTVATSGESVAVSWLSRLASLIKKAAAFHVRDSCQAFAKPSRLVRHCEVRVRAEEGAPSRRQLVAPRTSSDGMTPAKTAPRKRPSKAETASEAKPSAKKRRRLEGAAAEIDDRFQMRPEDEDEETAIDPPETSTTPKKKAKAKAKGGRSDAKNQPVSSSERKKKRGERTENEDEEKTVSGDGLADDAAAARAKRRKAKREVLAERAKRKQAKRGVVYLGAIPPRMKPTKLRQLLAPFGALDRVYLTPEDPSARIKRKKYGGNTGKNFTEGWVEFLDKKKARRCAEMLNGTQIGGKRRNAHYSDLWMLKYLPKFKWDNLLEEIEYQKAIREQKMQLELAAAKKERDFYLQKVEQSKQIEAMVRRRESEGTAVMGGGDSNDREETKEEYAARMKRERLDRKADRDLLLRKFKQRAAVGDVNVDDGRGMMAPDVLRDLFAASAEGPRRS